MKKINLSFCKGITILFIIVMTSTQSFSQTDYSVPISFSVTQTGINRFIASQWSNSSFTKSWNITYQGYYCEIELKRPSVSLSSNTIKIVLSIELTAINPSDLPVYLDQTFSFTPTLNIPETTISFDKIYAEYTNLLSAISEVIPESQIQGAINQALAPIDWVIYEGKILNESTMRWTEESDIGWFGLPSLTFAVESDEVVLTVTPTIRANEPDYKFYWQRPNNRKFGIKIISNNNIEIRKMILSIQGSQPPTDFVSSSAAYDPVTQKYVATYFVEDNATAEPGELIYTVGFFTRVKRGTMETAWHPAVNYINGTSTTWHSVASNPIHGE
jgi:hypothetical protein